MAATANEVFGKRGQFIVSVVGTAVLDRNVLTFNVARLAAEARLALAASGPHGPLFVAADQQEIAAAQGLLPQR